MNGCRTLPATALLVFLVLAALPSAHAGPSRLESLKKIFAVNLDRITKEYDKKISAWPGKYTTELQSLQTKRQRDGDLEGWQIIKKELARFTKDRKVTTDVLVEEPAPLRTLQRTFVGIDDRYALEKSKAILDLTTKYKTHLADLKKQLTIQGKMEDAIAADTELKRVRSRPEVSAAEFIVAAHQAAQKQPEPGAATPQPDPVKEKPVEPTTGTVASSPGVKVYDKNERPATDPQIRYKRLLLRPLKLIPGGASVAVSALHAPNTRTIEKKHNALHATYTYKEEESDNHIRLSLRTGGSGSEIRNAVVAVQVFATDVAVTSGRAAPAVLRVKHAALPRLTTSYTTIDYPPAKTKKTEVKQRTAGRSDPRNKKGKDFHGLVITVFDSAGSVIYQAGTDKSLQPLALTQLPEAAKPRAPMKQPGQERPGGEQPAAQENIFALMKNFKQAREKMTVAQEAYNKDNGNKELEKAYQDSVKEFRTANDKMAGKWKEWKKLREERRRQKGQRGRR